MGGGLKRKKEKENVKEKRERERKKNTMLEKGRTKGWKEKGRGMRIEH